MLRNFCTLQNVSIIAGCWRKVVCRACGVTNTFIFLNDFNMQKRVFARSTTKTRYKNSEKNAKIANTML